MNRFVLVPWLWCDCSISFSLSVEVTGVLMDGRTRSGEAFRREGDVVTKSRTRRRSEIRGVNSKGACCCFAVGVLKEEDGCWTLSVGRLSSEVDFSVD